MGPHVIFVTVGTTDFDALISAMDNLAPALDEPVVMQVGRGKARPAHAAEWFTFAPTLEPYYRRANLVVSHGGLGTVVEVLRGGGRLVAVSNPERYDRHQEDLLSILDQARNLYWCRSEPQLSDALNTVRSADFSPYEAPACTLQEEIATLLAVEVPRSALQLLIRRVWQVK